MTLNTQLLTVLVLVGSRQEQSGEGVFRGNYSEKFRKIDRTTTVMDTFLINL